MTVVSELILIRHGQSLSNVAFPAADAKGLAMSKDQSREIVYGMPYEDWKNLHQSEASPVQKAAFEVNNPHK